MVEGKQNVGVLTGQCDWEREAKDATGLPRLGVAAEVRKRVM